MNPEITPNKIGCKICVTCTACALCPGPAWGAALSGFVAFY
jgi:hypothetical protein